MFQVSVHNINLHSKSDPVEFANRLHNFAAMLNADAEHPWQMIGLNECFARRRGKLGPVYIQQEIDCVGTGQRILTANCLAGTLATGPTIAEQWGEIGIVANGDTLKRADAKARHKLLGYKFPRTARRQVVGLRLSIGNTGYVLPFYSTHISAFDDGWCTIDQVRVQLEELMQVIRKWWIPGDLTPVLVGDFNSHKWDDSDRQIIDRHFERVLGNIAGHIEHIYIGRHESFPFAAGKLQIVDTAYLRTYYQNKLTDHPVPFAILQGPGELAPAQLVVKGPTIRKSTTDDITLKFMAQSNMPLRTIVWNVSPNAGKIDTQESGKVAIIRFNGWGTYTIRVEAQASEVNLPITGTHHFRFMERPDDR